MTAITDKKVFAEALSLARRAAGKSSLLWDELTAAQKRRYLEQAYTAERDDHERAGRRE